MKLRLAFLFALAFASTAQAILWIVPSRFSAASPSPTLLWWQLNTGSGTNVNAEVGPASSTNAAWVTGKSGSGYALDFNGSSHYAKTDSSVTYASATKLTVCFWAYFDDTTTTQIVVESSPNINDWDNTFWCLLDSGTLEFRIVGASSGKKGKSATAPSTGAWTHIAAVLDWGTSGGDVSIYYNGSLQSMSTTVSTMSGTASVDNWPLNVGARNGGSAFFFNGRIDDLRVYTGDVSASLGAIIADPK